MESRLPSLSVVMPAYNEETRLPPTLEHTYLFLREQQRDFEILVVDDGSTDRTIKVTEELADKLKADQNRIDVVSYGANRGKGFAVKSGVLRSSKDWVLMMDSDGATSITELPRLENAMKEVDIAVGSRAIFAKDTDVITSPLRKAMGRVFNFFANCIAVPNIADTQCGFKLFKREPAQFLFSRLKSERFSFDVEILHMAQKVGMKIAEIPINWRNISGSKVNLVGDSLHMFLDLIKIRLQHRNLSKHDLSQIDLTQKK